MSFDPVYSKKSFKHQIKLFKAIRDILSYLSNSNSSINTLAVPATLPDTKSEKGPFPLSMYSLCQASHIVRELLQAHKLVSSTDRHL